MGRRGPKAEAAAVKGVKAAVRSKRAPFKRPAASAQAAPAVVGGAQPPSWLKGESLVIWHRLAPTLAAAKLLGPADEMTFGRYCRNLAAWLSQRDGLELDGFTYEAESYVAGQAGQPGKKTTLRRLDPRFMVADRLERQLLAVEDRFGMNPSERQRIFAARMNSGATGDLFDAADRRADDPAARAAAPASPVEPESPVGLLN